MGGVEVRGIKLVRREVGGEDRCESGRDGDGSYQSHRANGMAITCSATASRYGIGERCAAHAEHEQDGQ